MTRVIRGVIAHKRRSKILKDTKGFRGSSSLLFRVANQRRMKAFLFAFRDRRFKKRSFRRLWISRINAAVRHHSLNYSTAIFLLKQLHIKMNRKWLSQLAIRDSKIFSKLIHTTSSIPRSSLPVGQIEAAKHFAELLYLKKNQFFF